MILILILINIRRTRTRTRSCLLAHSSLTIDNNNNNLWVFTVVQVPGTVRPVIDKVTLNLFRRAFDLVLSKVDDENPEVVNGCANLLMTLPFMYREALRNASYIIYTSQYLGYKYRYISISPHQSLYTLPQDPSNRDVVCMIEFQSTTPGFF